MPETTRSIAADRLRNLTGSGPAAEAFRALGISARVELDDGAETLLLSTAGTTTDPGNAALISADAHSEPPLQDDPDVVINLASSDVLALADGELDVLVAVAGNRITARGPIFAAIGLAHAITQL